MNPGAAVRAFHEADVSRFWESVDVLKEDDCWEWKKSRSQKGYGNFKVGGRMLRSHRVAYAIAHGRMPEAFVLHSCDNPPCCNPSHLREGDARANSTDRNLRRRTARGERSGQSKLTSRQVRTIRRLYATGGYTQEELAEMNGVSQSTISLVVLRKVWA